MLDMFCFWLVAVNIVQLQDLAVLTDAADAATAAAAGLQDECQSCCGLKSSKYMAHASVDL